MRQSKRKKRLYGMTLIEVTVAMIIIIIVTLIAYMGVSASANFTVRGTDFRNADGPAVSMIESRRKAALDALENVDALENGEEPAVTAVAVNYKVYQISYDKSEDDSADTTAVSEVTDGMKNAGLIEAEVTDNGVDVRYDMYLPVTVPADTP